MPTNLSDPRYHYGTSSALVEPSRGRASRTAALMAVQRGLESTRAPRTRLFDDPLARSFLPLPWRAALGASRLGGVRAAIEAIYDFVGGRPVPRLSPAPG